MIGSGYRSMWVFAMFDLPVETRLQRRNYTRFRKALLRNGFIQLQYSIYARSCASEESAQVHSDRVRGFLPPDGEVRVLTLTDKQYGRMQVFWGKSRKPTERAPVQLELF